MTAELLGRGLAFAAVGNSPSRSRDPVSQSLGQRTTSAFAGGGASSALRGDRRGFPPRTPEPPPLGAPIGTDPSSPCLVQAVCVLGRVGLCSRGTPSLPSTHFIISNFLVYFHSSPLPRKHLVFSSVLENFRTYRKLKQATATSALHRGSLVLTEWPCLLRLQPRALRFAEASTDVGRRGTSPLGAVAPIAQE